MQNSKHTEYPDRRAPTVLIVEDEILVRAAAARYLRAYGFEVVEAVTADEALELLRAAPDVRAVFSDVKLPGKHNGIDLAATIRRDYPHIRILLTSAVAPFPEVKGVTLLRKPYFLFEVERQLRSLLGMPIPGDRP